MKHPHTLVKLNKLGTHTYTNGHITHIKSLTYVLMTVYVLYILIHLHMETCRFIWLFKTKLYECMFLFFLWTHTVPHPLRDARHILMKFQEHGFISAAKSAGRGSVDGVSQRERERWDGQLEKEGSLTLIQTVHRTVMSSSLSHPKPLLLCSGI